MADLRADVVVVGAGPAGSLLARLLARAGIDVLLLDRATFPRAKACGDCLSAEAGRLLARQGLLPDVLALQPARLAGWRILGPHTAHFEAAFADIGNAAPLTQCALAVSRERLDAALLEAAVRAGARALTGAAVTGLRLEGGAVVGVRLRTGETERSVQARLVVGADGLRSRVARELGAVARPARRRKLSLTTHVELSAPLGGFGEMHAAGSLCLGVAPVTADGSLCNVTLVADAARHGRDVARDARAFFVRSLAAFPQLRARPSEPRELLASGPFDVPVRRIAFDGAVLVGDAAGYFDPFTGQGVYHALAAAERLAPVVTAALHAGSGSVAAAALAPYVAAHRALTRGPRRVQRLVDAVVTRPALAERAIAALARRSVIARALLAVTGDVWPARALLDPRLALALLVPDPLRAEAA